MKVRELKKLIANVDDDAEVMVPGDDHSLIVGRVEATTGRCVNDGDWWNEDYDGPLAPEEERRPILLVWMR